MLTVWRRLWIERDAMAVTAPGSLYLGDYDIVRITDVSLAPLPGHRTNYYWLHTNRSFMSTDAYEGGVVELSPTWILPVVANSGSAIAVSTARLTQSDIDLLKIGGTDAVLREDDSETVLGSAASPRLADGGGLLTSAFAQMYVLPQYDDVHNVHRTIAFDRHVDFSDLIGDPPYDNARDLPSTDNFWATLVVSCYEGRTSEDADPDEGPMVEMAGYGETPLSNFASNLTLIYYETLRDMHDSFTDEAHTVVHEIAHAGCDDSGDRHSKTGIMQVAAPRQESDFDAETIVKIRRKKYW